MGKNLYTLLFFAATTICVGISGYLSYYGYLVHLRGITIFFAALIVLLLFTLDMLIRHNLINGRSNFGAVTFFIIVTFFSGVSNFNYLYNNFMAGDIANREVRQQLQTVRQDLTETQIAVSGISQMQSIESQRSVLERELAALWEQIEDPLRPGCGERCLQHVNNIYNLLGGAPTDLAVPAIDANRQITTQWFNNFSSAVRNDFENAYGNSITIEGERIVRDIDQILATFLEVEIIFSESTSTASLFRAEGRQLIDQIRLQTQEIERRANAILPQTNRVTHTPIESYIDKIGEIPIALHDGFIKRPNIGVTLMAMILAIFVDIIPVLFAFLIFRSISQMPSNNTTRRRTSRVAT